uniref:NIDO domain-containing protein n=1 Tax=Biomphalaria glabrata TaxID=6526 RepID=A0A2C9JH71_BIOGL
MCKSRMSGLNPHGVLESKELIRSAIMMKLFLFTLCLHLGSALLAFGTSALDTTMSFDTPAVVELSPGFPYYGTTYSSVTIQKDGVLVFNNPAKASYNDFSNVNDVKLASIGAWIAGIGTAHGNIFYRLSNAPREVDYVTSIARKLSNFDPNFTPLNVLVVTWAEVGTAHYGFEGDFKKNTIQLLLATDGVQSFVVLDFDTIEWCYFEDLTNYLAYGDLTQFDIAIPISTKAGFFKGDGPTKFLFPVSMNRNLFDIKSDSNIGDPGVYVFRVDETPVNATLMVTTTPTSTTTTSSTTSETTTTSTATTSETTTSTTTTTPTTTTSESTTSTTTTTPTTTTSETTTSTTTTTPTTTTSETTTSTTTTTPTTTTSESTTSTTTTTPTTTTSESTTSTTTTTPTTTTVATTTSTSTTKSAIANVASTTRSNSKGNGYSVENEYPRRPAYQFREIDSQWMWLYCFLLKCLE